MKLAVFGEIPADIMRVQMNAVQFSPHIPGSESIEDLKDKSYDQFYLYAPPGTIERQYTMAKILLSLKSNGSFTVLAPKDKGGSRIRKELESFGCEVEEDSRRHHKICQTKRPENLLNLEVLEQGRAHFDESLKLWTQPGVFSWNRIDPGTSFLLENLPELHGHVADLGAGLGVIAKKILTSKNITHVTLLELDRRAKEASEKNIDDSRRTIFWGDIKKFEFSNVFDFVVTNPPFHVGGIENQSLGKKFIQRSGEILKNGSAYIVANRHLPYEDVVEQYFSSYKIFAENNAYKIIEAKK